MKVVFDLFGAPAASGGMRSYATEVVAAWGEHFPEDRLVLVGYRWTRDTFGDQVGHVSLPTNLASRCGGQWVVAGLIARAHQADALISVSQVVSPLMPRRRRFCVVHDWRHVLRPHEFGAAQRLYRRSWRWSVSRAGAAFQNSVKTAQETRGLVPGARSVLTPLGRDHARRWAVGNGALPANIVLTFGHLPNKRADLVLRAFASIAAEHAGLRLVVLGARGPYAEQLRRLAEDLRIDAVALPGFVTDEAYRELLTTARVVVLASSDEGFGLPVTEANYFGVPCVVTSDSGLDRIHPGRVIVADPTPHDLGVKLTEGLATGRITLRHEAETWGQHVTRMRATVRAEVGAP